MNEAPSSLSDVSSDAPSDLLSDAPQESELPLPSNTTSEVVSYGIHRFSTATRLIIAFAIVACLTAIFLAAVMITVTVSQQFEIEPLVYMVLAAAILLVVVVATVVGFYLARGITMPIKIITCVIDEIKDENFSARTGFSGFDEIGRLGRTLDDMAETIQRNTEYERQITVDVAHELRTPLMAMQANLEAMIDGVMPANTERLVTVNSEVVRLGRLVEGQLKLSRLEARKVEINPRRLNVGKIIARLMSNYILLVEGSDLTLECETDDTIYIVADSDLIRQAAANLLSNAVRYTPEGGSIKVTVQRTGKWAQIVVADTGIGISKEDQKSIFNKFWRANDDRNRDRGGLGIGLAMVREIAHMHSGKITVESELGMGSKFIMSLPASA